MPEPDKWERAAAQGFHIEQIEFENDLDRLSRRARRLSLWRVERSLEQVREAYYRDMVEKETS